MNDVQMLIDRQLGIYCQLNYDNILKRLVVDNEESFYGLQSANIVASFDQDPPIFACRFSEAPGYEHILALANEDGRVAIQNTTSKSTASTIEGFQCHNNAVFDLAWMPGHMSFVTVSGDHTACLWDVGEGAPKRVQVFSNHTRSVKTAAFRPVSGSVFATGARDGNILVWDVRAALPALVLKPDNCLINCHSCFTPKTPGSHGKRPRLDAHRAISITGLVFQDDLTLISCGECDGNIKVWDLRKNYNVYRREPLPKHSIPYCGSSTKCGYTNLIVDDARLRLYASCMDDVIYCFNISTYNALPERRYVGHENSTFYIKTSLSPDCAYLVSGSSDKSAYIWNVRGSEPVVRLSGHWAEVTCAAWGRAARAAAHMIVTCSDDARHNIWRIGDELLDPRPDTDLDPALRLRGRASPVPRASRAAHSQWGAGDRTPTSLKRRAPATPTDNAAKRPRTRPAAAATPTPARNPKRCLADLMSPAPATAPATGDGRAEGGAKRARPTVAEGEAEVRLLPAGVKRPREASPAEADRWGCPPARLPRCFTTPPKRHRGEGGTPASPVGSPGATGSPTEGRVVSFGTPTKNLPNYVLDGEAPHLRLMSPGKKKRDTTDWLTLIVRERRARGAEGEERERERERAAEGAPPRRPSLTDRLPKSGKKSRTLLKYFSVASREK